MVGYETQRISNLLERIDIPNPNHFGSMGSMGGPVSMLNNNLLTNSAVEP